MVKCVQKRNVYAYMLKGTFKRFFEGPFWKANENCGYSLQKNA